MRKTVIGLLILFGAAVLHAEESYLYWLQGSATYTDAEGKTTDFGDQSYTARVVAFEGTSATWSYSGGSYLTLYSAGQGGTPGSSIGYATDVNLSPGGYIDNYPRYANITAATGSSGWTYFVELFNGDEIFARSSGLSSSDASAYVYTTNEGRSVPANGFTAPAFVAASAPEPTSGLLLLLGSALLALRRKRA